MTPDPDKHPAFVVRQPAPLNGGPPPELLAQQLVTPNALFFLRSHGSAAPLSPGDLRLRVDGLVQRPLELTWSDLQGLPRRQAAITLQCAGNRRSELLALGPIPDELVWEADAVSTAEWTGVDLLAVLAQAGVLPGAAHIAFEARDVVEKEGQRFSFGGSIPIADAARVLLADTMNGEALPHSHGGPLRAVVPGVIGARSVKWLARITLQDEPSHNYFQRRAYRLYPASATPEAHDPDSALMLHELPVSSAICQPAHGARLPAGRLTVRGYALTGGTRTIERVELSANDGAHWQQADLSPAAQAGLWRLWQAELVLPPGQHTLCVRAWDSAACTQPERLHSVWNFKGYANNAIQRLTIIAEGAS